MVVFESENVLHDAVRIRRSAEDFARVIFEHADPARDVGGVLSGIVTDAELLAEHQRGDLGAKLLARVSFRTEGMPQVLAIESRRMTGPVAELVQGRPVISVRR